LGTGITCSKVNWGGKKKTYKPIDQKREELRGGGRGSVHLKNERMEGKNNSSGPRLTMNDAGKKKEPTKMGETMGGDWDQ